jgi:hypothetical protein
VKKKNVMLDLETFGNTTDSVVVAIGAVSFSRDGISEKKDSFYINVDPADCQKHGLTISASTVLWWLEQSEEARIAITKPDKTPLKEALAAFSDWMKHLFHGTEATDDNSKNVNVWGNGSDFDNKLLSTAYEKIGLGDSVPWNFRNNRCYRTIKNLYPNIKMQRSGDHHNALDDAESQAKHLLDIYTQTSRCLQPEGLPLFL